MMEGFTQGTPLLFDGETPALHTLVLTACPTQWYSLNLTRLTRLSLRYIPNHYQQDTADFLSMLGCLQDLTYLYLEDEDEDVPSRASSFLSSMAFKSFQNFSLPHLSLLHINAQPLMIIAFLSCVNVPMQTEVSLGVHPGSFDEYAQISSFLARRLGMFQDQALSSPKIRSLVIASEPSTQWRWTRGTNLAFSASERECHSFISPSSMMWGCNLPLQIHLEFGTLTTTSDRDRIISHICCPIPFPNVRSVHVLNPPSSSAFWMHVLGHLQDLQYIKLVTGDMPDLASVLSVTPRDYTVDHPDRDPNQIFAPAMEELELYELAFQTMVERDIDPLKVAGVQSLCDALATRKEPRGRLTMTRCTVRNPDGQKKQFDMKGGWEGGRFHVVELKVKSDTWAA
ncbi:hypothetical protein OG21DRAFT_913560 [Imleria badia]|nr:hypothetical protein OG21DRAFT_913560 [Imleria badia]